MSKEKRNLIDTLKGIEAAVIGNKANLFSTASTIAGLELTTGGFLQPPSNEGAAMIMGGALIAGLGITGAILSGFGQVTRKIYQRTKESISKQGYLDERVLNRVIQSANSYDDRFMGYCELQGAYLAAREAGPEALEIFKREKRKYSKKIIPNF